MKNCWVGLLFAAHLWAQTPTQLFGQFDTDRQIKLFQGWVAADPSIANRSLLAGAYIQKTRETTDFGYLDRASKILQSVLAEKQDPEAMRMRNVVELTLH